MCRKFQDADLPQLMAIWRKAMEDSLSFLPSNCVEQLEPYAENYIKHFETFVHPAEGEPQGFITLTDSQILYLYVLPKHQRKGIGHTLLDYAKSLRNVLTLEVHERNSVAIQFYKRSGFNEVGESKPDSCDEQQKTMSWRRSDCYSPLPENPLR